MHLALAKRVKNTVDIGLCQETVMAKNLVA
jgi:hypothetical protein